MIVFNTGLLVQKFQILYGLEYFKFNLIVQGTHANTWVGQAKRQPCRIVAHVTAVHSLYEYENIVILFFFYLFGLKIKKKREEQMLYKQIIRIQNSIETYGG